MNSEDPGSCRPSSGSKHKPEHPSLGFNFDTEKMSKQEEIEYLFIPRISKCANMVQYNSNDLARTKHLRNEDTDTEQRNWSYRRTETQKHLPLPHLGSCHMLSRFSPPCHLSPSCVYWSRSRVRGFPQNIYSFFG